MAWEDELRTHLDLSALHYLQIAERVSVLELSIHNVGEDLVL